MLAATCAAIEVTGAGDLSGIYKKDVTLARPTFRRRGGVDIYSVYSDKYSGVWTMKLTLRESYPKYEVSQTILLLNGQLSHTTSFVFPGEHLCRKVKISIIQEWHRGNSVFVRFRA